MVFKDCLCNGPLFAFRSSWFLVYISGQKGLSTRISIINVLFVIIVSDMLFVLIFYDRIVSKTSTTMPSQLCVTIIFRVAKRMFCACRNEFFKHWAQKRTNSFHQRRITQNNSFLPTASPSLRRNRQKGFERKNLKSIHSCFVL